MIDSTRRSQYRFKNYKRSFVLFSEAVQLERELNQLEKEGGIQRFEYAFELGWKTMKDYLESEGVYLPLITPATVIKAAFEAKLIQDGQVWMDALDARNKMSHTYDFSKFEQALSDISQSYLAARDELHMFFLNKEANYAQWSWLNPGSPSSHQRDPCPLCRPS
ncbi:MAG: nucleotidyltransferase substrate binding protein [Deltaproteobacteria bacterium]|jgi:nucleotidyltransferase substrate binding protein (TIGR01987 family)|nr:nucleotidyltransferase substrate binding protein [Deltaproteobacteria bacterium]